MLSFVKKYISLSIRPIVTDVQGTTKKKEAARRANARATGGGPPPVSDLRPWESAVCIQRSIISNV
jgi:hypothetical protein